MKHEVQEILALFVPGAEMDGSLLT